MRTTPGLITISPDGKYVANFCPNGATTIYETSTNKEVGSVPTLLSYAGWAAFSADSKLLACLSRMGSDAAAISDLKLYDIAERKVCKAAISPKKGAGIPRPLR